MQSSAPPSIVLDDVVVAAPGGRRLLGPVSLRVAAGERVAVVGPSGAGKSLLAACVADTLPADLTRSGTVTTGRVALVPQDDATALNPLVPVGRQVARPLRAHLPGRGARRTEVERLLALVGLEEPAAVARRCPAELSGGQRQRACLALAVACRAGTVVSDEATTALDVVTEAGVLDVLAGLDATLLVVTHDLTVAARTCERVLVVDDGRVVEDAALDVLLDDPVHPVARDLVQHARLRVGVR